jgi:hypothetical protein
VDDGVRGDAPVFDTAEALLAGATDVEPLGGDDGKSGASLRRLKIDGQPYVAKSTTLDQDWTMRVTGDTVFRPLLAWRRGIMGAAPPCIDHATVGMALEADPEGGVCLTILMRDISAWVVPEGDDVVSLEQHRHFVEHMAALAATFWGFTDDAGLASLSQRVHFFSPDNVARELARPDHSPVIDVAARGWETLPHRAPALDAIVRPCHEDPGPLVDQLAASPQTFLHGDWKMGNLGSHADGRTILLDWAYPGRGPAALELTWYLALNAARLPERKDDAIAAYRAALEQRGVDTRGWWDQQLAASIVAIMVMFGWEKAVGGDDELAWWEARVVDCAGRLA